MGTNQDDEIEIDLKELFFVMRRKLWVLILAGMLGAAVSGIFTATMMKPVYTSSTMLYIVNKTTTLTSLTDLQLGSQLTKDYKVLVTSRPVTGKVIENLDLNLDHEQLLKKLTVANPQDTRILTISVEDNDPYMAKAIADEMASVAAERMAEIMDTAPPNIVEEGYVPTRQTSPSLVKNTAIGGIAGLFLAAVIVLLIFVMNDTIKTPEDVEKYLQLTVLGTIPVFDVDDGKKGKTGKKKRKQSKRAQKAEQLREETEQRIQRELSHEKYVDEGDDFDSGFEDDYDSDYNDDYSGDYNNDFDSSFGDIDDSKNVLEKHGPESVVSGRMKKLPDETREVAAGSEYPSSVKMTQPAVNDDIEEALTGANLEAFVRRIMAQAIEGTEASKEETGNGTN